MLAGECQQENTKWIDPEHDKVSHAVRQGVGLAGAGAGDDEERCGREPCAARRTVRGGQVLGWIQTFGERVGGHFLDMGVHGRGIMAENCIKQQKYNARSLAWGDRQR